MSSASQLRATYRLQLGGEVTFGAVAQLVPYLRELGVSHLYLSPSLQAREGSTHGYDVIDPTRVSDALGGEGGLRELARAGMPIVLDIVPNHMAVGEQNRWWIDDALRVKFFDIDPLTGRHRRFFDIDDLAGVRQEDPEVFAATHAKVLELVGDGVVWGLRVDHPDGLADPAGYLHRLRDGGAAHVWVEKILSVSDPSEDLRDWPVEGTVGYRFLNEACALFIDPDGERELSALWTEISGDPRPFRELALEGQLEEALGVFEPDLQRLALLGGGFALDELARAMATLPVYRTYVEPWSGLVADEDRDVLAAADAPPALVEALLLRRRDGVPDEFVTRFQQTSPAVTAKGIEDTAFYRHLRLLALNDVGGNPSRFSLSVEAFHLSCVKRQDSHPRNLLATQTHDTKRSGDARARIAALASMAGQWRERVARWRELAAPLRQDGVGPDPVEEYLIYQTLVGVWPIEPRRLDDYLRKSLREAKRNSTWAQPDEAWEGGTIAFAHALLAHEPFVEDLRDFMEPLLPVGEHAALAQLLLKLTCPGVPDIYQGDELWSLALVDPDNRRPVDWQGARAMLGRLREGATPDHGELKMWLIMRALALRARQGEAFEGSYTPLHAGGHVCAFLRGDAAVLVAVTLPHGLGDGRPDNLELGPQAAGTWRDLLGERDLTIGQHGVLPDSAAPPGLQGLWLLERAEAPL